MCEPEIQPLVPLISRSLKVMQLLILRHRILLPRPAPVPPYVVPLGEKIDAEVYACDVYKIAIPLLIAWRVVVSVDVRGDDAADLDRHVVERRRYRARPYRVRVPQVPAHLNRVCFMGLARVGFLEQTHRGLPTGKSANKSCEDTLGCLAVD